MHTYINALSADSPNTVAARDTNIHFSQIEKTHVSSSDILGSHCRLASSPYVGCLWLLPFCCCKLFIYLFIYVCNLLWLVFCVSFFLLCWLGRTRTNLDVNELSKQTFWRQVRHCVCVCARVYVCLQFLLPICQLFNVNIRWLNDLHV